MKFHETTITLQDGASKTFSCDDVVGCLVVSGVVNDLLDITKAFCDGEIEEEDMDLPF